MNGHCVDEAATRQHHQNLRRIDAALIHRRNNSNSASGDKSMGLLKANSDFFANLLDVSAEKSGCNSSPVVEDRLPHLVAVKTAACERFQAILERRAKFLKRRICKLQVTQSALHVSRELNEFINFQRWAATDTRAMLADIKPDGTTSSVVSTVLFSGSTGSEQKPAAMVTTDAVKEQSSPDDAQELGSTHVTDFCIKQRAAVADYVKKCVSQKSQQIETVTSVKQIIASNMGRQIGSKVEYTAGSMLTNLNVLEQQLDSDATASSSGGESCDEMEGYDDRRSKPTNIQRRAFWKWAVDRAGLVSRWTWLQAQVSDLEYRIRQTSEIHRQIRRMKDPTVVGGRNASSSAAAAQVNGLALNQDTESCSRTCVQKPARKRKLLRTFGYHFRKSARLSTIQCGCLESSMLCAICEGRTNKARSALLDTMSVNERVALLDPSFHPVLSFPRDISLAIHFDALVKGGEFNKSVTKQRNAASIKKKARNLQLTEHARKQCRKLKKNATVTLTTKLRKKMTAESRRLSQLHCNGVKRHLKRQSKHDAMRDSGRERYFSESSACSSKTESPVPSPEIGDNSSSQASGNSSWGSTDLRDQRRGSVLQEMLRRRRGESAFDINNIVIPYSMAASTRVERLQYKEIITPKWRVMEEASCLKCFSVNADDDDISEEAVIKRHDRCEVSEKKRFMSFMKAQGSTGRRVRSMRSDSRADSSGANTPDPVSPHAVEHHDSLLVTPPSTPAPGAAEEHQPLSVSQRRRTTSLSRRDRMVDDFRVSTPPEVLCDYMPVAPWEHRTFPLVDSVYEAMVQESACSVNDMSPSCDASENQWKFDRTVTGDDDSPPGQCVISDWSLVTASSEVPDDCFHE